MLDQSQQNFERTLLDKVRDLSPDRAEEVLRFIDFLRQHDEEKRLNRAVARISESSFEKVWDNPDDAIYDTL